MPLTAPPDVLSTFTEVFIALMGFSGVVIALGRSEIPETTRRFRVKALLVSSSVGLGASVLPSVVAEFTRNIWPLCTGVLGACMVLNLVWALRNLIPMVKQGDAPPLTFWLVTACTVAISGVLLALTFGPARAFPVRCLRGSRRLARVSGGEPLRPPASVREVVVGLTCPDGSLQNEMRGQRSSIGTYARGSGPLYINSGRIRMLLSIC